MSYSSGYWGYVAKLLILPVCSNFDAEIDDHIHTKRLCSLGLCFLLSSILVFGSVFAVLILPVYAQDEYVVFPETISVSSSDLVPHNFILKAISKHTERTLYF
jgi:hypothetical protein